MISFPIEWLALGSILISLGLVVSLVIANKKSARAIKEQLERNQQLESKIDALTQQLTMLNKGTLGMGKRLMNAEKRLNQTMERQDSLENKDSEQISYKQAARLFERGLEMDNVIEQAGITR